MLPVVSVALVGRIVAMIARSDWARESSFSFFSNWSRVRFQSLISTMPMSARFTS